MAKKIRAKSAGASPGAPAPVEAAEQEPAADPFREEDFRIATASIFDLVQRCPAGPRYALGRLSWALGKAALQSEDIEAADVFLAVAGALETPGETLLHEIHGLARLALVKALDRQIPDSKGPDAMRAYGMDLWVEIDSKTALGRHLVEQLDYMRAPHEPPYSEEELIAGVVAVLRIGQRRIGLLRDVPEEELVKRVTGAFRNKKKPLSDDAELAAATILYAAGMPTYQAAHNAVKASKANADTPSRQQRRSNRRSSG